MKERFVIVKTQNVGFFGRKIVVLAACTRQQTRCQIQAPKNNNGNRNINKIQKHLIEHQIFGENKKTGICNMQLEQPKRSPRTNCPDKAEREYKIEKKSIGERELDFLCFFFVVLSYVEVNDWRAFVQVFVEVGKTWKSSV